MEGLQEKEDNWKQFLGSELGSVLSGIYGNQRPKINYPVPKKKSFDPAKQKFLPVNSKIQSSAYQDPRKTTRRHLTMSLRTTSTVCRTRFGMTYCTSPPQAWPTGTTVLH